MRRYLKFLIEILKLFGITFPLAAVVAGNKPIIILSAIFAILAILPSYIPEYKIGKKWHKIFYYTAILKNEYKMKMYHNTFFLKEKGLYEKTGNRKKIVTWTFKESRGILKLCQDSDTSHSEGELKNMEVPKVGNVKIIKMVFYFEADGIDYKDGKMQSKGFIAIKVNSKSGKIISGEYYNNKPGHGTYVQIK